MRKKRLFLLAITFILGVLLLAKPLVTQAYSTDELGAYVKSLVGTSAKEWGGGSGTQCVELPKYYLDKYFGLSTKSLGLGNGNTLYKNIASRYPGLFERIDYYDGFKPLPGDIISYHSGTSPQYGHAAVVYSVSGNKYSIAEQWKGSGTVKSNTKTVAGPTYGKSYTIIGVARPRTNNSTPGSITPITSKPATVGSGYTTSGTAVKTLQTALNKVNNAGLTVDGKYGNNTKNAIINYQKKKGLTADGICGPKTWEKLIADYNAFIKYTVTFDANGGNGAPGNQSKTYGQNLTLSSTKPTRTGHAFQGWATSSGGSVAYQPGGTYSNNAAITLYAVWKVDSYTVSYNANGGSGAPGNQTKTYGQNLTLSSTKPTRTGHAFQGWATSSGGSVAYQPGGTYSNNAAITLYAVWKVDSYIVSYNANGGSGAPGNQTKTYGQNLTLSSTKPTRTGYNFQGWSTSSDGSVAYQGGSTYSNNATVTLYAVWQPVTYTVSYNANGGSGAPGNQTKTYGQNLTLSGIKPTRGSDYTFKGWATSAGGNVAYQPGSTYSSNASMTLYAVWEKNTPSAASITLQMGTANGKKGDTVLIPVEVKNNPGFTGMTFGLQYDTSKLELLEVEDAAVSDWYLSGTGMIGCILMKNYYGNGVIVKLKFKILQSFSGSTAINFKDVLVDKDELDLKTELRGGSVSGYFPGDINGDLKVNIHDVVRLLKYSLGEKVQTFANTDVNGDSKVNIHDVVRLLKYVLGEKVNIQ